MRTSPVQEPAGYLDFWRGPRGLEGLEETRLIPLTPCRYGTRFPLLGFGGIHLLVQKLHNPAQLRRNLGGDKQEPHFPGLQIGFGLLPEQHGVLLWPQKTGQLLVGIDPATLTLAFKLCPQGFNRPVDHGVGRIVEHLSDHFAADTCITAAFHFDKRWDSVLVEKEVIDCPPPAPPFLRRQACFTGDKEPPARLCRVDLLANEEMRIAR